MGRVIVPQHTARYVPKTNQLYNPTADVLIIHHTPIPEKERVSGCLDNMVSVEEKKKKPQIKKEVYINELVSARLYH